MNLSPELPVSAEVVAFPAPDPSMRLTMALRSLAAALETQRLAVADFRASLQSLKSAVGDLGTSMATYQKRVDALNEKVQTING
jgi:hypothetical protein